MHWQLAELYENHQKPHAFFRAVAVPFSPCGYDRGCRFLRSDGRQPRDLGFVRTFKVDPKQSCDGTATGSRDSIVFGRSLSAFICVHLWFQRLSAHCRDPKLRPRAVLADRHFAYLVLELQASTIPCTFFPKLLIEEFTTSCYRAL
jgi:hypothetical protein